MKKIAASVVLALLLSGCVSRDAALHDWMRYLSTTEPESWEAQHAARLLSRVCKGADFVQFLWQKAKGPDPETAVAACSAMAVLVHTPTWSPSEAAIAAAEEVDSHELLRHLQAMRTDGLSAKWRDIHRRTIETVERNLEQAGRPVPK